nr:beta-galactosidase 16-like [Ipomoea batatas]
MQPALKFDSTEEWEEFKEPVVGFDDTNIRADTLLEHMNTTKDVSDYLCLQQESSNPKSAISVESLGHVLHIFVNGELAGAYLEHKTLGPRKVTIEGSRDLSNDSWGYQVGLLGENLQIYTEKGSNAVEWREFSSSQPLIWYKTVFDEPKGNDPLALNLGSMGKGEAWVNGQSIGRYWVSFHTLAGTPSQTWYNVPRSFLKPTGNLLVLFEEEYGNPYGITLDQVSITLNKDIAEKAIKDQTTVAEMLAFAPRSPPHGWAGLGEELRLLVHA